MKSRLLKDKKKSKHSIFIVDDHAIVREGLKKLIEIEKDFIVSGEAENGFQALDKIPTKKPDIVIIDLNMEGMNGIEVINRLKDMGIKTPLLVMSMLEENVYAEKALRAGASGYVMKNGKPEDVIKAIRRILEGKIYVSELMTEKLMHKATSGSLSSSEPSDVLSNREFEIFELIGNGLKAGDIAKELKVSVKTVEFHRDQIKHKLGLENAAALNQLAVQWMHKNNLRI